ncbi:hypothetical protein [uncultured Sphingomonas sp.]|uniref:hypothetical protein n=1 Tax=uncultured Sphingomonas sp. TaxID=158754 RepID=UPI0035CA6DBD
MLAPGHPAIVDVGWPNRMAAPVPPPPYVPPLDVRLIAAATLDRASGFCVKRSWHVTGSAIGAARVLITEPSRYRLASADGDCEAPVATFFGVDASDRPRAFTIMRLLAAAAAHPNHVDATVSIGDGGTVPLIFRTPDGAERSALLSALPLDRTFAVGRYIVTPLLSPVDLAGVTGTPRETWELDAFDPRGAMVWTIQLALDGDRIAALRMIHAVPAPF